MSKGQGGAAASTTHAATLHRFISHWHSEEKKHAMATKAIGVFF